MKYIIEELATLAIEQARIKFGDSVTMQKALWYVNSPFSEKERLILLMCGQVLDGTSHVE